MKKTKRFEKVVEHKLEDKPMLRNLLILCSVISFMGLFSIFMLSFNFINPDNNNGNIKIMSGLLLCLYLTYGLICLFSIKRYVYYKEIKNNEKNKTI